MRQDKLQIADIMTEKPLVVPPKAALGEAISCMREARVSCLLVVEEDKPVGIVSERDCVRLLEQQLTGTPLGDHIADVMTSPVITVLGDMPWQEGAEIMRTSRIRRLAVVNSTGELTGVVTQSDLLASERAARRDLYEEFSLAVEARTHELATNLQEAERARYDHMNFLATVAHEIRTPMAGVVSMAELLKHTALEEKQSEFIDTIVSSGHAMGALVDDILDFAKMQAHAIELEHIEFQPRILIEEVADLLAVKAQAKGLDLRVRCDFGDTTYTMGDPGRLRQILTNLCGNAIKFTTEGEVLIAATLRDTGDGNLAFECEIQDTGIGIPEKRKSRLFQAYTQADASIARRYGGTGLGLVISKNLVNAMDGQISVDSVMGEGSTFSFSIKLKPGSNSTGTFPCVLATDDPPRALVIDGTTNRRDDLAIRVQQLGVTCVTASSLADGTNKLAAHSETLRYIFVRFPLVDRKDRLLLDQLGKQETAEVYLLTTVADHALGAGMTHYGFSGALTQPVKTRSLRSALGLLDERKTEETGIKIQHQAAKSRFNILVADDNKVSQLVIAQQLRHLGYECVVVSNGAAAVEHFKERAWDLILMDHHMPDMSGPEAATAIRRLETDLARTRIPILALTGIDSREEIAECLSTGMDAVLTKPIALPDLERELATHLCINEILELSEIQADALTELMNIGVGHGAAQLSQMLESPISLHVPSLVAVHEDQLANLLNSFDQGDWSSVHLGFGGSLGGTTALLISSRGAAALLDALGEPTASNNATKPGLNENDQAVLIEVGNIVLNGVIGAFSNVLEQNVVLEVPSYTHGAVKSLFAAERVFGSTTLLLARTHFVVRSLSVEGAVMVVLGLDAFEKLLGLIDRKVDAA